MDKKTEKLLHLLHIFSANLILQVFGGAGAIWGFSEVLGLRTPETVWFWRPMAQFVGAIFFARWVLELDAHMKEEKITELFQCSSGRLKLEVEINDEEQTGLCSDASTVLSPVTGIAMQNTGKNYKACK